jgi:hypothetical protein
MKLGSEQMEWMKSSIKLNKKYIAFLSIVPIMAITALIQVDCPVCHGQGVVSASHGMENVRIDRISSVEKGITRNYCAMFIIYRYEITMTLTNEGPDTAIGWIKMILIDFTEGQPLDNQYTVVEIPRKTSINVKYHVLFQSGLDEQLKTEVDAVVLTEPAPCLTCEGKGKVPLNTYFFINSQKDNFREINKVEIPLRPPMWVEPAG